MKMLGDVITFFLLYSLFSSTSYEDVINILIYTEGTNILYCGAQQSQPCLDLISHACFPSLGNITLTVCGRSLSCLGMWTLLLVSPLITCVTLETSLHLLAPGLHLLGKK